MPRNSTTSAVYLFVACWMVCGCVLDAAQPSREVRNQPADGADLPALPPGAIRVVNHARHGVRVAMCVEEPGPPIELGEQSRPRTRVWVHDGVKIRRVGTALGTCDPAWSPDGESVAVVAPDGLWVLSADLARTTHLVDTRHSAAPGDPPRTLSGPQWAPDASRLAFMVRSGPTSSVEAIDARTGRVIHSSDAETDEFVWGADSESLRFGLRVVPVP